MIYDYHPLHSSTNHETKNVPKSILLFSSRLNRLISYLKNDFVLTGALMATTNGQWAIQIPFTLQMIYKSVGFHQFVMTNKWCWYFEMKQFSCHPLNSPFVSFPLKCILNKLQVWWGWVLWLWWCLFLKIHQTIELWQNLTVDDAFGEKYSRKFTQTCQTVSWTYSRHQNRYRKSVVFE